MATVTGRVVLLVWDLPAARTLAHAMIAQGIQIVAIVVQTVRPRRRTWKEHLQRLLGDDLFFEIASLKWPIETREVFFVERQLKKKGARILSGFLRDETHFPKAPVLTTDDINSDDVYRFLQDARADLLVIYGTSILRKRTMETARLGALNAHTAVLPDYRGADAEFWQLYDRAYDKTGITIHFIDEGIDTGDIVHTHRVQATEDTDPMSLRALNTIQIIRDYPAVVARVLAGEAGRMPQLPTSTRCFRTKDLTDAHKRVLFERLKLLRAPMTVPTTGEAPDARTA